MDAHCENQVALTHRCSSHPSYSQERSSGPSLVSTRNPLVQWAATCELLVNGGAAPSSGHHACRHRLRLPSGGCSYLSWWLGCALWVSAWLVPVLGQAWVQWGLQCEAVHGHRSGLPSSSNFDSFGTRRPANLWRGAHVWRPGLAAGRQQESCGKPWRSREWSAADSWALLGRMKGPSAHALPSAEWHSHA